MAEKEDVGSWSGVERVSSEAEAALVVGFLKNHDIPARVHDKSFHQTPTSGEDLSPIEIAVPTDRMDEARRILDSREAAYAEAGREGDTLMTDEGPAEIDPNAPEGDPRE